MFRNGATLPIETSSNTTHTAGADAHATGEHSVSLFGMVVTLDSNVGTYAFIGFVIGLVVLEFLVKELETIAERKGFMALFQKLQKELMMMGIISFGVFIYETVAHPPEGSILLEAMELTHIIVLFMALAFIVQAFFLVLYATVAGKRYLSTTRMESAALIEAYKELERNPKQSWWFHHGSSLIPGTCPLRMKIETRIIERLFERQHKLPPEFNFAQYISILFETYTAELGEVSPLSWGLLAVIVLANYFRTAVIDPGTGGAKDCATDDHGTMPCEHYIVAYSYVAAAFMTVIILGLYIAATIYIDRVIAECLDEDGIKVTRGIRFSYIESLEQMIRKEHMLLYKEKIESMADKMGIERSKKSEKSEYQSHRRASYLSTLASILEATKMFKKKEAHMEEIEKQRKKHSVKNMLLSMVSSSSMRGGDAGGGGGAVVPTNNNEHEKKDDDDDGPDWMHARTASRRKTRAEENLSKIFFLNWPSLFFCSIEAALLFQCFYIAIVATQMIPVVSHWKQAGGYIVLYLVFMVINLLVIMLIIDKSVLLRSVYRLERDVAGKVCEDTLEIKQSIETFRNKILGKFMADEVPECNWKTELRSYFKEYDDDGSGVFDENEFREILSDLRIYMSRESFTFLWRALDFDLSGELTFEELFDVVFPEKKVIEVEDESLGILRDALQVMLATQDVLVSEWEEFIKSKFMEFDDNKSGEIDQKEFAAMLVSLNLDIPSETVPKIFKMIDQDGEEGTISFGEFWELVFPSGLSHKKPESAAEKPGIKPDTSTKALTV